MMKYVLITPARNEAKFIGQTIEAVASQTHLPERWVIVDDGSTDRTPEIAEEYARKLPWLEVVRRPRRQERNFAGKVQAVNAGLERVKDVEYAVVGNLDADISFAPDYMDFLMRKFEQDAELGVAGTPFTQDGGYDSTKDSFEGENYVAGPCQLFRRKCWEEIGGYVPNKAGGVDWIAVMTARMKGWKVRCYPDKRYHHYRSMGTAEKGLIASSFSYGERAYYLGWSPLWQLVRVGYRMTKRPIFFGGLALLFGYCWAGLRRVERPVSDELMKFHREEQMRRLKSIFGALLRFQRVDAFRLGAEGK